MASPSKLLSTFFLLTTLLLSQSTQSNSATCTLQTFTNNRRYDSCTDLPALDSHLHWSYDPSRSTLSIAFVAQPARPDGWVSWAINPTGSGMAGSQALIAFRDTTGRMAVKTYNVSSYSPLKESRVWFDVRESAAEFSGGVVRMFATVVLPETGVTEVNHVWQVGPSVTGGVPDKHGFGAANLNARGRLDLLRGQSTGGAAAGGGDNGKTKKRNIHGVLNVISWGIMFPIGIIIARYMRMFPSADPAWFYLHVSCQSVAHAVGSGGWLTGIQLGSASEGITHYAHRNIGIALFVLATVQVFAMFLRPKKDHKYRFYWNIYHHGVGYAVLVFSIVNIFKGFDILRPEAKWKHAYEAVIVVLGGIAVLLEIITWIVTLRRKKSSSSTKPYDGF